MLTSAERQPLRNAGRDAYFKAHGKHDWLLQAAKAAKGANAQTKELTAWKRNVCNRACFVKLCLRPTPLLHGSGAFPKFPIIKTSLGPALPPARASNTSEICNREVKTWNSEVVVFLSSTRGITQLLPHLGQPQEQ